MVWVARGKELHGDSGCFSLHSPNFLPIFSATVEVANLALPFDHCLKLPTCSAINFDSRQMPANRPSALRQNWQKAGKNCLLTPSARSGCENSCRGYPQATSSEMPGCDVMGLHER